MDAAQLRDRGTWKKDLAPYLVIDRARSLVQVAIVTSRTSAWIVDTGNWNLLVGLRTFA